MSILDGIKSTVRLGVDYLSSKPVRDTIATFDSLIDSSQIARSTRQTLFPNLRNANMDAGQRIGLNPRLIAPITATGLGIGVANAGVETFKPQPAPPPSTYYDGNGDLRNVNDMGAGPAFARSVMGRE